MDTPNLDEPKTTLTYRLFHFLMKFEVRGHMKLESIKWGCNILDLFQPCQYYPG